MDEEGLKSALYKYFHNGFQLNEDMIDDVIARLRLLINAVERSPSFRFYGTSLLIIHEGYTSRSVKRCPVEVRLIDFAHTICDYSTYDINTKPRSSSSPSVLKSSSADQITTINPSSLLSNQTPNVPQSQPPNQNSEIPQQYQNQVSQVEYKPLVSPPQPTSIHQVSSNNNNDLDEGPKTRKISKTSMGPDKGLLFGLENLMRLLDDLKSEYHSQDDRQQMIYPPSILIPNVVSMQL